MRRLDPPCTLGEIATLLDAAIPDTDATRPIDCMATLAGGTPTDVAFLNDTRYAKDAAASKAGAVLVRERDRGLLSPGSVALVVPDPYLAFARLSRWFAERLGGPRSEPGVHPSARVAPDATLGQRVRIGPNVVVEPGARIGDDAELGAGVFVGSDASVGARTRLAPNVVLYHECEIGDDCTVHGNTTIGADGFGFARDGAGWSKIAQLGRVVIGNRVEIGANCGIDRGAIDDTRIGDDCIIDNLVQIAHNVTLGKGCAMAGCSGIAGSATVGDNVLIGGGSGVLGHIDVASNVVIGAMTFVSHAIDKPGFYSGTFPIMDNAGWERAAAVTRKLPDLRSRLRALEKQAKENR